MQVSERRGGGVRGPFVETHAHDRAIEDELARAQQRAPSTGSKELSKSSTRTVTFSACVISFAMARSPLQSLQRWNRMGYAARRLRQRNSGFSSNGILHGQR